jgi:hypothetical protein
MKRQSLGMATAILLGAAVVMPVLSAGSATAPAAADGDFSAPQMAEMSFDSREPEGYLDLDTGEFLADAPSSVLMKNEDLRKAGIDLATSPILSNTQARTGIDLVLAEVQPEDWNASAEAVVARVGPRKPDQAGVVSGHVWYFKTREGSMGVLRTSSRGGFGPVIVEFKRIQPAVAAKLLAALPQPDYSTPEALVKTYLRALEIDDVGGMGACLHSNDAAAANWDEKYAAAQLAVDHLYIAARKVFGDEAVRESLEPVQPHLEREALASAQWKITDNRARPAKSETGPLAALELIRVKEGWKILLPMSADVGGVESVEATASAARQMAGTVSNVGTIGRLFPDAGAMVRAYANSVQTAKSQIQQRNARLQIERPRDPLP